MKENYKASLSAVTDREVHQSKLIDDLLKQGKITLNESRILLGLSPILDSQYNNLVKRDK